MVNHKRVQRLYREIGLSVKRNRRKRLTRPLQPRPGLTAPPQQWSIDFASDVTASGRRLRVLSVVDSFTRQCHALEVDTSFPSRRVTRVLDRASERFGKPQATRCDNGPELCSRHFLVWAIDRKIDAAYPARETNRECLWGELPRPPARRVPEHQLVVEPARCTEEDRRVAAGL